ncbi:hypothetical protein DSUL_40028 [Desulfovibrionales bacterium]
MTDNLYTNLYSCNRLKQLANFLFEVVMLRMMPHTNCQFFWVQAKKCS